MLTDPKPALQGRTVPKALPRGASLPMQSFGTVKDIVTEIEKQQSSFSTCAQTILTFSYEAGTMKRLHNMAWEISVAPHCS